MKDLNDLYIFSQVVEHNGFTGAARALGVARSSICRRIAQLEEHLGVRLVQRSTRHFSVTELGMEFYGYCVKMVAEAKAAYERVACARGKPSGIIRVSCPAEIAQLLISPLIPRFIEKNPEVRIALEATNRKVELDENFDLSVRVRQLLTEDSGMVMRSLGIVQQVLVASREFRERYGTPATPAEASQLPTLSYGSVQGWIENGRKVEPFTQLASVFERATGQPPFQVPASWMKVKDQLDMTTKFDLATNNDIIGGNSGSPLINAKGQIVGLVFDGNIHSISGSYWFDEKMNRTVAVHPAIIQEALAKVYGAKNLLAELQ